MNTPETRVLRHRETIKPISSKKALFGKQDKNESDIGPMTPLRFGNKRHNTTKSEGCLTNITALRNFFGNESPDSDRSLSPDFAKRYTNNGRYELLSEDHDKENLLHADDEETRFSFTTVPETPCSRLSVEESAQLDENNSNSLSMLMNSDLNLVEKLHKPVHRTPGVTTRSQSAKESHEPSLGSLLRRPQQQPQHQQKGTQVGTPDTNSRSPTRVENKRSNNMTNKVCTSKARTALQFSDLQSIPVKSFYSSAMEEDDHPVQKIQPMSTKSFYSSSLTNVSEPTAHSLPLVPPSEISPGNSATNPTSGTKNVSNAKTPRKATSMRKRSKSFCNTPRLGQKGMIHKIRKPSKKSHLDHKASKKGSKHQQKNRAIAGKTKSCPTTPKNQKSRKLDDELLLEKLHRVNGILQRGQKKLNRALSMTDLVGGGYDNESLSSEEEDSSSELEEDGGNQTTQRKFFRSRRNWRSNRKVYNHLNSIAVSVRSGGKRKLINFPQVQKRRRFADADDEYDFQAEQLEVEDLISRLDQNASGFADHHEQACDTVLDHNDDDAPIPIQPNVIYLKMNEFTEASDTEQPKCQDQVQDVNRQLATQDDMNNLQYINNETSTAPDPNWQAWPTVDQSNNYVTNQTIMVQQDINYSSTTIYYEMDLNTPIISYNSLETQCLSQRLDQDRSIDKENSNEYYPIFYAEKRKELSVQQRQQTAEPEQTAVLQLLRQQNIHDKTPSARMARHAIGQSQYQIDAGQRTYGAVQCKDCGLTYSTNEPEEERFHDQFHRAQDKLSFPTFSNELVITQVPEWDVTGRIIVVSQVGNNRHLLKKVHEVLEIVDTELGFATQGQLPEGACAYLAIARGTLLGVCVVQPLHYANRMICLEGLHGVPIDCYSSEFYPAKCGISRIWVAPKYRRHGIGRKLIASIRTHYIFGYAIKCDEIAFGAPTEQGKLFAAAVCRRKDFLVYV